MSFILGNPNPVTKVTIYDQLMGTRKSEGMINKIKEYICGG